MSKYKCLPDLQRECIDATKVFDYVLTSKQQCFENVAFTFSEDILGREIVVTSCQIAPTSTCIEISDQNNRPTIIVEIPDCPDVELEIVTLQKTIIINLTGQLIDVDNIATDFTATATVIFCPEEVLLCAPTGTLVDCVITDTSRCVVGSLTRMATSAPNVATGNVHVLACQSIQSYAPVKLEILAKICDPRSLISIPECEVNPFPQQCPSIFPPAH
ncbi:hypothetical protein [Bacillus solimangrovi]|uniref:DUF3794 domain-containing protein n=1 Tax=Bacillus solimangrovi TaxID=1305675 RepID=A0A1E5LEJ7_9BACI|nr:hypothetical protein [Bacillus solimangrovi]OEH92513.1 hypothetical protein BFG57_15355 [Bacillus solimangrovi]